MGTPFAAVSNLHIIRNYQTQRRPRFGPFSGRSERIAGETCLSAHWELSSPPNQVREQLPNIIKLIHSYPELLKKIVRDCCSTSARAIKFGCHTRQVSNRFTHFGKAIRRCCKRTPIFLKPFNTLLDIFRGVVHV